MLTLPQSLSGLLTHSLIQPLCRDTIIGLDSRLLLESLRLPTSALDAARMGSQTLLLSARELGSLDVDAILCDTIVENGYIELVKLLYPLTCIKNSEMCPWSFSYAIASEYGEIDIMKYLDDQEYPWIDTLECASVYAAGNNHLEVLKYLYTKGFPLRTDIYEAAAGTNNIELLEYLYNIRCPWSELVCEQAANNNCLDALKYLRAKGCPWNREACLRVSSPEVREWILSK